MQKKLKEIKHIGGKMELLIVILNKEEYFERILSILVEAGVSGATIFESEGMGHFLAYEVPIFAGLRQLMGGGKSESRTIMAVLEDEKIFKNITRLLNEDGIDFTKSGVGIMMTVPVNKVKKSSERG